VSFRGAYVRTSEPPPVNSLVRLIFTLPPDGATVTLSAHVIRVAPRSEGLDQYPGFVARFVALDGPVKQRWEELIAWLRSEHAEAIRTTVTFARQSYLRLFQQKAPTADDLWLRPATVEDLLHILDAEVPGGVLAVPSTEAVPAGANVTVRLVHPVTQDVVVLPGIVRRRGEEARPLDHVLVNLLPVPDELQKALAELADSVVVLEDYDIELFEEPELAPSAGAVEEPA
jgi:hypothetical protein